MIKRDGYNFQFGLYELFIHNFRHCMKSKFYAYCYENAEATEIAMDWLEMICMGGEI